MGVAQRAIARMPRVASLSIGAHLPSVERARADSLRNKYARTDRF